MSYEHEDRIQWTKDYYMKQIAANVTDMIASLVGDDEVVITYCRMTEDDMKNFTDYARQAFSLRIGDEYFFVQSRHTMYIVDVTADSPLTAASELMSLIARKF